MGREPFIDLGEKGGGGSDGEGGKEGKDDEKNCLIFASRARFTLASGR